MLPTQEIIDHLAERIERAFVLRRSRWYRGCSTPRVWSAAAQILWERCREDAQLPLDPEFFVASQPISSSFADPWASLAQADAGVRYQQRVHRIIRRLRKELRSEVGRVEAMIVQGCRLSAIVRARDSRLSPLGLYITAHRNGRPDLAARLCAAALEQHKSCPLYRPATLGLLSPELYPTCDGQTVSGFAEIAETPLKTVSLN